MAICWASLIADAGRPSEADQVVRADAGWQGAERRLALGFDHGFVLAARLVHGVSMRRACPRRN
ncbi:hypothetical protein AMIS_55210 [Actinoplanes missouriensis 431]|uniref:Uncharacterized protein n=1 Tax=Actinoplanes missouriensis (strain ATCC 14538 / DSM 43046 / CBS 188.64 / JCM 3121 / NBRC 102363 / NCIMB 12654 / NRRL B-3342 / UNCC 431) TaxID=512565 RepID=I0HCK4_ACTM4|nr:hypothetical protein AMIS_55210 [Actinoplanes missouriensis 431]